MDTQTLREEGWEEEEVKIASDKKEEVNIKSRGEIRETRCEVERGEKKAGEEAGRQ